MKSRVEKALAAALKALKTSETYATDPYSGPHLHTLERDRNRTREEGGHVHKFLVKWEEKDLCITTQHGGEHLHGLCNADAVATENDGAHTHDLVVPDGETVTTEKDGTHVHKTQLSRTYLDGSHQHTLEMPDGTIIKSMTDEELAYQEQEKNKPAEVVPDVTKAEPPKGPLPTLKMPDPAFNIERLQAEHSTGVLSRIDRTSRTDKAQLLINEVEPTKAEGQSAWGIVVLRGATEYKNFAAIPAELKSGIDRFSVAEFQNIAPVFYMPMEAVKLFTKAIPLKSLVPGRRFGPEIDLEVARADKAQDLTIKDDLSTADLPPMTGPVGVAPKIPFKQITPAKLKNLTIEVLLDLDNDAHLVFDTVFGDSKTNSVDGLSREDLVNAHIFIVHEMIRRDEEHPRIIAPTGNSSRDALDTATLRADPKTRDAYKNAEVKDEVIGEHTDEEKAFHIEERKRRRAQAGRPAAEKADAPLALAPINSGSEGKYDEITLEDVLDNFSKGFLLRAPVVRLVGSLVNHGKTKNDIDVLVEGPLDPKTLHVIKFRLGRMLPGELSKRLQFHTDDDPDVGGAGPFTSYVDLFDLKVEPSREKKVIDMSKAIEEMVKANPAYMQYPEKEDRRPAVLQAHFRGKSVHLDFRLKTGDDFLTGWTLAAQKAGVVPDVDTVGEGKQIASSFDVAGSDWNKPLAAPDRVRAFPKQTQPLIWLSVGGKRFEPGQVGATAEEAGVFAEIAKPKVTPLILTPFFAEYAVEDDPKFGGLMTFRLLTGQPGASQEEIDAGRQTHAGEAFWTGMLAVDLTPAVLKTRAVHTGLMPPLGRSGLPIGIRAGIPRELQYWREKTEKAAQEVRDELVHQRLVTVDTVKFINNRFRLVAKQKKAWAGAEFDPLAETETVTGSNWADIGAQVEAASAVEQASDLLKQLKTAEYSVVWQRWKGPVVIRSSPTKEIFHFFVKRGEREVEDFMLQSDPLEDNKIAGVQRTLSDVDADKILALNGPVKPGEKIGGFLFNESKDTPSSASVLSKGTVEFLEDSRSFKKFRIKGGDLADVSKEGLFTLVAEEAGGILWQWERGQLPSRSIPEQKIEKAHDTRDVRINGKVYTDVQIWDPAKMRATDDKTNDRQELRPLAFFQPMKTTPRPSNEYHTGEEARLFEDFATLEALKLGILVQPKYNGWRVMPEKDEKGQLLLLGEDLFRRPGALRNNYEQNPGLRAAAEKLPGPYVLDAEFMAVDSAGNFLPRRDLAAFRGAANQDDAGVRLMVHRALYLPGPKNMVSTHEDDMLKSLVPWLNKANEKHFVPVQTIGIAHSKPELLKLIKEAGRVPGSEGAMLKLTSATYTLGGFTDSWAKIKLLRTLRGIVTGRHEVSGSPGVYNFAYAFGPIPEKDRDLWASTVDVNGKHYVPGGLTFNRKLNANVGDVIEIEVTELLFDKSKPGKWKITGFTPTAVDIVSQAPMTPDDVIEFLSPDEIQKALATEEQDDVSCRLCVDPHSSTTDPISQSQQEKRPLEKAMLAPWMREVRLMKADKAAEERFVLGVVLEPETIDGQRDIYSADEIRKAAHGFMEHFAHIGLMHTDLIDGRVKILESYLAPVDFNVDGQPVKRGTWLLGARIVDDQLWEDVKDGKLTGWSIGGSAIKEPDTAYQHLVAVLTN